MHKLSRQKIAAKLSELNEEKGRLEEELDEAIEKVAAHEKRQMAEDILIKAHQADEVPSKLKPASVEDFFAKRAQLEEKSPDELEKLAALSKSPARASEQSLWIRSRARKTTTRLILPAG